MFDTTRLLLAIVLGVLIAGVVWPLLWLAETMTAMAEAAQRTDRRITWRLMPRHLRDDYTEALEAEDANG